MDQEYKSESARAKSKGNSSQQDILSRLNQFKLRTEKSHDESDSEINNKFL